MTWLIWWIRCWFCKHSFVFEEKTFTEQDREYAGNQGGIDHYNIVKIPIEYIAASCKKCGWHRSYSIHWICNKVDESNWWDGECNCWYCSKFKFEREQPERLLLLLDKWKNDLTIVPGPLYIGRCAEATDKVREEIEQEINKMQGFEK